MLNDSCPLTSISYLRFVLGAQSAYTPPGGLQQASRAQALTYFHFVWLPAPTFSIDFELQRSPQHPSCPNVTWKRPLDLLISPSITSAPGDLSQEC